MDSLCLVLSGCRRFDMAVIQYPFNPVPHVNDIEIEYESQRFVCELQICQSLRFVDGQNSVDTFQLDHDATLNQQI